VATPQLEILKALSGLSLKGLRICGGRRDLNRFYQMTPTSAVEFKIKPPVKPQVESLNAVSLSVFRKRYGLIA
jgi:hypothetical protein